MKRWTFLLILILFAFQAIGEEVVTSRTPTIRVTYEENVLLTNYTLIEGGSILHDVTFSGPEIIYVQSDMIYVYSFKPIIPLQNGDYEFIVIASDLVNNKVTQNKTFKVQVPFPRITLQNPKNNVSNVSTFDLIIQTSEPVQGCGYAQTAPQKYDQIPPNRMFTSSNGITHTINGFTIGAEDYPVMVYIVCKDSEGVTNDNEPNSFSLLLDTSPPQIKTYSAPAKVIENLSVELVVESIPFSNNPLYLGKNDLINCKFSKEDKEYDLMEYSFYTTETYTETNRVTLTNIQTLARPKIEDGKSYTFHILCKNRPGLISNKEKITFDVNLSEGSKIEDAGPSGKLGSTEVKLYIDTNRLSSCNYKLNNGEIVNFSQVSQKEHEATVSLSEGQYDVNFYCYDFIPIGNPQTITKSFTIDMTPPQAPIIYTESSCEKTRIKANITSQDQEKVVTYQYKIKDSTNDITTYTNTSVSNNRKDLAITGLDLDIGSTYYLNIIAYDEAGNPSAETSSQPITILNSSDEACKEKTPPTVSVSYFTENGTAKIYMMCRDDDSGCKEVLYNYLTETTTDCASTIFANLYTTPITQIASGKICYKATDNADNTVVGEENITIDSSLSPNETNTDSDYDGIPDDWEIEYGLDPNNPEDANLDNDGDGLSNLEEYILNSNPLDSSDPGLPITDSDSDGMPDDWEIEYGLDINNYKDKYLDPDKDGLTNYEEYVLGTDPTNPDTDGDGFLDGGERTSETDLMDSSIKPVDTDSDGIDDSWEIKYFGDILIADKTTDSDNDGITDYNEYLYNSDPTNPDTDGDGLPDGEEINQTNTNSNDKDTDGDGATDKEEIDAGTDPLDPTSHPVDSTPIEEPFTDTPPEEIIQESHLISIILLSLGILMVVGGSGYLYYKKNYAEKETQNPSAFQSTVQQTQARQGQQNPSQKQQGLSPQQIAEQNRMQAILNQRIALQQQLLSKRRENKMKERSSILSSFGDQKQETKQEFITSKDTSERSQEIIAARKQKEEMAKKTMQDMVRKQQEPTKPKDDTAGKLDTLLKKDSTFAKLEKISTKTDTPDHIQEKLSILAHEPKKEIPQDKLSIIASKSTRKETDIDKLVQKHADDKNIFDKLPVSDKKTETTIKPASKKKAR